MSRHAQIRVRNEIHIQDLHIHGGLAGVGKGEAREGGGKGNVLSWSTPDSRRFRVSSPANLSTARPKVCPNKPEPTSANLPGKTLEDELDECGMGMIGPPGGVVGVPLEIPIFDNDKEGEHDEHMIKFETYVEGSHSDWGPTPTRGSKQARTSSSPATQESGRRRTPASHHIPKAATVAAEAHAYSSSHQETLASPGPDPGSDLRRSPPGPATTSAAAGWACARCTGRALPRSAARWCSAAGTPPRAVAAAVAAPGTLRSARWVLAGAEGGGIDSGTCCHRGAAAHTLDSGSGSDSAGSAGPDVEAVRGAGAGVGAGDERTSGVQAERVYWGPNPVKPTLAEATARAGSTGGRTPCSAAPAPDGGVPPHAAQARRTGLAHSHPPRSLPGRVAHTDCACPAPAAGRYGCAKAPEARLRGTAG